MTSQSPYASIGNPGKMLNKNLCLGRKQAQRDGGVGSASKVPSIHARSSLNCEVLLVVAIFIDYDMTKNTRGEMKVIFA